MRKKRSSRKFSLRHVTLLVALLALALVGAVWFFSPPRKRGPEPPVVMKVLPPVSDEAWEEEEYPAPPPEAPSEPATPPSSEPTPLVLPSPIIPLDKRPRVAIVIDDMGVNARGTERALRLPSSVTFSFLPYGQDLSTRTRQARAEGHEVLLHMPMEPKGHINPGPDALLTDLPSGEIRARLERALGRFEGFNGLNNHMGSRFTEDRRGMALVMEALKERKLYFLDSRTTAATVGSAMARTAGVPTVARDVFLDDVQSAANVAHELDRLEKLAHRKGKAVAIGHPHPETLEALERWIPEAEKRGLRIVPLRVLLE